MSDFPRAMYAADGDEDVWGRMLKVITVNDADEQELAEIDGFVDHPHKLDPPADEAKRGPGRPPKPQP